MKLKTGLDSLLVTKYDEESRENVCISLVMGYIAIDCFGVESVAMETTGPHHHGNHRSTSPRQPQRPIVMETGLNYHHGKKAHFSSQNTATDKFFDSTLQLHGNSKLAYCE